MHPMNVHGDTEIQLKLISTIVRGTYISTLASMHNGLPVVTLDIGANKAVANKEVAVSMLWRGV